MRIPAAVADLCDRFLAEAPVGLVTGLYLRGGTGFGEWVEGVSDVDFVATLAHRPSPAERRGLRAAHDRLRAYSSVPFDGLHVLAEDLTRDPRSLPDVPTVLHGRFQDGTLDAMVAWHELARHGITVAGPPHTGLGIWTDTGALHAFTLDNLDTYWRRACEQLARSSPDEPVEDLASVCTWCVLGVARLHHLLVTDEMTTKSGAGRWGLAHYDARWHRVLREALRLREGGEAEYDDEAARLRDTAAFTAYVVEQGTGRPV